MGTSLTSNGSSLLKAPYQSHSERNARLLLFFFLLSALGVRLTEAQKTDIHYYFEFAHANSRRYIPLRNPFLIGTLNMKTTYNPNFNLDHTLAVAEALRIHKKEGAFNTYMLIHLVNKLVD